MDSGHQNDSDSNKSRKCTDIYAPIVWFVLLISVIVFCLIFSSLDVLTKGRDDCGNICGELNDGNSYDQCGPNDMRNHPKLLIQRQINKSWIIEYKCAAACPQHNTDNIIQCWEKGDSLKVPNFLTSYGKKVDAFWRYMMTSWMGIGLSCVFTFLFSGIVLILLRFMPQATMWVIPILLTALLFVVSVLSIIVSFDAPSDGIVSSLYLYVGFFVILMIVFVRKIILAGKVFGESAKFLMDVPWVTNFIPIVTFIILTILIPAFLFTSLLIESSGTFSPGSSEDGNFMLKYEDTKIMKIARILNILTFAWFANFFINCQHFVVAASVTKWYFTRDKSGMGSFNMKSLANLVRFHLGSVCFGAIAVPFMRVIHAGFRIVKFINFAAAYCFKGQQSQSDHNQTFNSIDRALGSYSKSAIILIERNGTKFSESGSKSYDLMLENLVDVYWLNLFKDVWLIVNQMFVPFVGIFVGLSIVDSKADEFTGISPLTVDLTFTFLFAHCFFMVFGMAIDTILLCCCIDLKEQNGDPKSLFMSAELKKIVMKIRKSGGLEVALGEEEAANNMTPMLNL